MYVNIYKQTIGSHVPFTAAWLPAWLCSLSHSLPPHNILTGKTQKRVWPIDPALDRTCSNTSCLPCSAGRFQLLLVTLLSYRSNTYVWKDWQLHVIKCLILICPKDSFRETLCSDPKVPKWSIWMGTCCVCKGGGECQQISTWRGTVLQFYDRFSKHFYIFWTVTDTELCWATVHVHCCWNNTHAWEYDDETFTFCINSQ